MQRWIKLMKILSLTTLTLQLTIACATFSGCSSVPKLKIDLCGVNFAMDKPAHLHCFNTVDDYDNGVLKPDATAENKPITTPAMLNGGKFISKEDWKLTQAWLINLRSWSKDHCQ